MSTNQQLLQLEKTVQRLKEEQENKSEIFEALHDGIIVFKPNLSIKNINNQAKKLLSIDMHYQPTKDKLPFFKNKKTTLVFKLDTWLNGFKENPSSKATEALIWHTDPSTYKVNLCYSVLRH